MAFTLGYQPHTGITVKDDFGDEATYTFLDAGVLKIVSPDSNGKVAYYPPTVWMSVFADKNHHPGQPGGDYDVAKSIY